MFQKRRELKFSLSLVPLQSKLLITHIYRYHDTIDLNYECLLPPQSRLLIIYLYMYHDTKDLNYECTYNFKITDNEPQKHSQDWNNYVKIITTTINAQIYTYKTERAAVVYAV